VFHARLLRGPTIAELPAGFSIVPLSDEGTNIRDFQFPERFGLLPGVEGPGLPAIWRERGIAIPIADKLESLNAAAALAIALYVWKGQEKSAAE
jgi:16S rRNA (guanine527-N7)-methyltransferase